MKQQFPITFTNQDGKEVVINDPKKKVSEFVSPNPVAFNLSKEKTELEALAVELTVLSQIRKDEGTLIWGSDDAEPLHILNAIANSPTATACVGKLEMYTKGEKFMDEGLMDMVINKDGDTLWDLHCQIVQYYSALDGFSTNFKYNAEGKITNAYNVALDSLRFAAEPESREVQRIKHNPYFGTALYRRDYTEDYELFDISKVNGQIKEKGTKFTGQIYYHNTKRTLYKFYPMPKFWAGKKWIYADAKLATYIDTLLDNGFFSSVLMNVIGDPNLMSQHPDAMVEETGTDGVKRKVPKFTEGEMFNKFMGSNFAGVQKAAKAMVFWSKNKDQLVNLSAFPTTTNFDFVDGTLNETIRMISLSFEVPAILANLPDVQSPLSGQDALPKAIDFMQSNTAPRRAQLEKFYNNILLPNWFEKTKAKVKIQPYAPTKTTVTVDDKFWEFMNEAEKIKFIQTNEPSIELIREKEAEQNTAPATQDENGNIIPAPTAPKVDDILKGLKVMDINRILSWVSKVNSGTLTPEQARLLLAGYGLNEEQINAFLNPQPVEQ